MRINEIFYSIQGEGLLAGMPSTFIRTTGCNLRCTWCDTPLTSWNPTGQDMSIDEICANVDKHPTRYVVITGGEPMIARDMHKLCHRLKQAEYHITIETAATCFTPVRTDLASLSPKLANSTPHDRDAGKFVQSHEAIRINVPVIRQFMANSDYQLKFVVSEAADLAEIETLINEVGNVDRGRVMLMPEGTDNAELEQKGKWIAELCKERGFRYCPRLHIALYGNTPGT